MISQFCSLSRGGLSRVFFFFEGQDTPRMNCELPKSVWDDVGASLWRSLRRVKGMASILNPNFCMASLVNQGESSPIAALTQTRHLPWQIRFFSAVLSDTLKLSPISFPRSRLWDNKASSFFFFEGQDTPRMNCELPKSVMCVYSMEQTNKQISMHTDRSVYWWI